mgnify:CR=1 FL=1
MNNNKESEKMKNEEWNGQQTWTAAEKKRLLALRTQGLTWDDIANQMNRTKASCRVKHNRILVVNAGSKERTTWTVSDANMLKNLHRQGTSLKKMAIQLQRTDKAVLSRMYLMGLMDKRAAVKLLHHDRAKDKKINATPTEIEAFRLHISASRIFAYVQKLEQENKRLEQALTDIQDVLSAKVGK